MEDTDNNGQVEETHYEPPPEPQTEEVEAPCRSCGTVYKFDVSPDTKDFTFKCQRDGVETKWVRGTE